MVSWKAYGNGDSTMPTEDSLSHHIYVVATQTYLQGYKDIVIIKDVETKYHDIPIWWLSFGVAMRKGCWVFQIG